MARLFRRSEESSCIVLNRRWEEKRPRTLIRATRMVDGRRRKILLKKKTRKAMEECVREESKEASKSHVSVCLFSCSGAFLFRFL